MKRGNYRPAVFILTYRKEKGKVLYLLLKRKLHWKGWEFPKGGIEKKETPMQAVIRELKEETNLSPLGISSHHFLGNYSYDKRYSDRRGFKGQSWHLFTCEVSGKIVRFDRREHSEYKWLQYKEAQKLLTWPNQKACLTFVHHTLE